MPRILRERWIAWGGRWKLKVSAGQLGMSAEGLRKGRFKEGSHLRRQARVDDELGSGRGSKAGRQSRRACLGAKTKVKVALESESEGQGRT